MTRILALLMLLIPAVAAAADIIDRVAVSLENKVITDSEVVRQLRITALLNNEQPDLSPSSKRETAERLVDQALIRREIETSRYVPESAAHGEQLYSEFRKRYPTDAAWKAALAKYNLADQDVRDAFVWQATFLDFVEVRFRPGVSIPESDIHSYYDEQVKGKSTPEATPSFEEARPQIEAVLTQQRVDNALDRWLGEVRTQTRIRYRQEAFK